MGEFRIGTSISEPAQGSLKLGENNINKIYKGDTLIWPSFSEEYDPYVPIPDNNVKFLGIASAENVPIIRTYNEDLTIDEDITPTSLSFSKSFRLVAVSENKTYIYACNSAGFLSGDIYRSGDGGLTWNNISIESDKQSTCMSNDGQYVYIIRAISTSRFQVFRSSDYGLNFQDITPVNAPNGRVDSVACSSGGKYVWIISNGGSNVNETFVWKSSDYGQTFQDLTTFIGLRSGLTTTNNRVWTVSVSGNGQYIYFLLTSTSGAAVYKYSNDFGSSFTAQIPVPSFSSSIKRTNQTGSIVIGDDSNEITYSTDYLNTSIDQPFVYRYRSLSNFGKVSLFERSFNSQSSVVISNDYLQSFEPVVNFSKPDSSWESPVKLIYNSL